MKKTALSLTLLLLSTACSGSGAQNSISAAQGTADVKTYKVTFTSNWNLADHLGLPGNAHFSPIVAVSHNDQYQLLAIGQVASPGLELVAELGDTSIINQEIDSEISSKNVGETLNTQNMFVNQVLTQSFEIAISPSHPYLSFVSMIAPSPDWVVGVSNMELYSVATGFSQGTTAPIPLFAYNAGTENGDTGGNFSIGNAATSPLQPMTMLTGPGFNTAFAFVTIELVE